MRSVVTQSIVLVIVCLFVGGAAAQTASSGTEAQARSAFERGRVLYDSGAFVQAAQAFEEAHRLSGRDALLYNLYLAHRDANQPEQAAQALRGFLTKVENVENRAQLEARLSALEQGLARDREQREREAARSASAAQAQPVQSEAPALSAPASPPPASGRSPRFIAAVSLVGAGGALMLTSVATGLMARSREDELERKCVAKVCDSSLRSTRDSGQRLARTTDALLFGGAAVAAAGAVLLVLDLRANRERQAATERRVPRLAAHCSASSCAATATLRF
jgi:hypothetical protein